jgi:hypothetical protein
MFASAATRAFARRAAWSVVGAAFGCVGCGQILGVNDYHVSDKDAPSPVPAATCPELEAPLPTTSGAGCVAAGVPADACPLGFVHDATGGCRYAYEDAKPCSPDYLVRAPSNDCRSLSCSAVGPPGYDQYVDGAYALNDSDGTVGRPWKRIQDGVDHARPGGSVYVAGASLVASTPLLYRENVVLTRGVSLSGSCRALAEIQGPDPGKPTVTIELDGSSASVGLGKLGISGASMGILVVGGSGADGGGGAGGSVHLDEIGIHDVAGTGVELRDASASITDGYVRRTTGAGVLLTTSQGLSGISLAISGSSIQTVRAASAGVHAGCVVATPTPGVILQPSAGPLTVGIDGSLLEDCSEAGVFASGANVTVTDTVIRRVRPSEREGALVLGQGIAVERDSLWKPGYASPITGIDATLELKGSLIEDASDVGVSLQNVTTVTIDGSTIRGASGRGAEADSGVDAPCPANGVGVLALAEASDDQDAGYRFPSKITVTGSLVDGARVAGIQLEGVSARVERTIVSNTRGSLRHDCPRVFGDGIVVYSSDPLRTDLDVVASRIDGSDRAAVATFGPGHVTVESASMGCDAIGLAEDVNASPMGLPEPNQVVCACGGPGHVCSVERAPLPASSLGGP